MGPDHGDLAHRAAHADRLGVHDHRSPRLHYRAGEAGGRIHRGDLDVDAVGAVEVIGRAEPLRAPVREAVPLTCADAMSLRVVQKVFVGSDIGAAAL